MSLECQVKRILVTVAFAFCEHQNVPALCFILVQAVGIGSCDQILLELLRNRIQTLVIGDLIRVIVRLDLKKVIFHDQFGIHRVVER